MKRVEIADSLRRNIGAVDGNPAPSRSDERPEHLKVVIDRLCKIMLSSDVPSTAKSTAGKVFHLLQKSGPIWPGKREPLRMQRHLDDALANLVRARPALTDFAAHLGQLAPDLVWRPGPGGPFASMNYPQNNLHAIITGRGGLEARGDLTLGLTLLGPYCRFPDFVQRHARMFLMLSYGEMRFGDDQWFNGMPGSILYNAAETILAMRCTSDPMFVLWCEINRDLE